jgi:hypothetical protein
MIANVHAAIQHVKADMEWLPKLDRWRVLLAYVWQRIVGQIALSTPPPIFQAAGYLLSIEVVFLFAFEGAQK